MIECKVLPLGLAFGSWEITSELWNILPKKSGCACLRPWPCCTSVTTLSSSSQVMIKAWAGIWVAEICHMGASCLCDWLPVKTLDTKSSMSYHGWQFFTGIVTHCCDSINRGYLKACVWFLLSLWVWPMCLFPLLTLIHTFRCTVMTLSVTAFRCLS